MTFSVSFMIYVSLNLLGIEMDNQNLTLRLPKEKLCELQGQLGGISGGALRVSYGRWLENCNMRVRWYALVGRSSDECLNY